ncbi:hypothetical protein EDD11_004580 [Mortierella claussenii]|nr:hypothetical protein EDD11_004580 [Mortierella claussenii]
MPVYPSQPERHHASYPRADPIPQPSSKSAADSSSSIPAASTTKTLQDTTETPTVSPVEKKPKKQPYYTFDVLNPSPNDSWISGSTVSLSWVDVELPPRTTFDFTLVPVDPETNPEALNITRRPMLRYISAMDRFLEMVVPYDLITKEQLIKEQEDDGEFVKASQQDSTKDVQPPAIPSTVPTGYKETTPPQDIRSLARLVITAYVGKSSKVVAQKTIFPIEIKKDHARDRRTLKAPPPSFEEPSPALNHPGQDHARDHENEEENSIGEVLEKKDSDITHREDYVQEEDSKGNDGKDDEDDDDDDDKEEEDGAGHEIEGEDQENSDKPVNAAPLDLSNTAEDDDLFEFSTTSGDAPPASTDNQGKEGQSAGVNETEEENKINISTPTGQELDEDTNGTEDPSTESMGPMDHDHDHSMDHDYTESEEEMHHDHLHTIDLNHFQNDEDIKIWEEIVDKPGYNPPVKVIDAGSINITHWIDNKVRFFIGAPYVFGWEFPESGKGLTGVVSVYVEDAFTGKRYDMVAGNLPSDVLFMYLHPTAIMMSANPKKRIYLRARVEMDLFKLGNIQRYTGFSKMFWVERGAL